MNASAKIAAKIFPPLLALIFSSGVFYVISQYELKEKKQQFNNTSKIALTAYKDHMQLISNGVLSLNSFYLASDYVSPTDFQTFSQSILQSIPEIKAVEWVPVIKEVDKQAALEVIRNTWKDFEIFEKSAGEKVIRKRTVYYPVIYINPFKSNEAAHGFDLGSNPERRKAISLAIDSGEIISTAPISLIQESEEKAVLVFKYIKKENFEGLVLAVIEPARFLRSHLTKLFSDEVHYQIIDVQSNQLLNDLSNINQWLYSEEMLFAGRHWKINFQPKEPITIGGVSWFSFLASFIFFLMLFLHIKKYNVMQKRLKKKLLSEQESY